MKASTSAAAPSAKSLAAKLQMKPGRSVAVLDAPDGFVGGLGLGKDAAIVTDLGKSKKPGLSFDVVQIFVGRKRDIETRARRASEVVGEGGAFWVAYPKQGSGVDTDVTRDAGWDALTKDGWAPVAVVALDATWSSMRFKKDPSLQAARRARAAAKGAAKPTTKAPAKSVAKVAPATKKPAAKPAARKGQAKKRSA